MVSPDGGLSWEAEKNVFGPPDNLTKAALSNGGANLLLCVFPNVCEGLAMPRRVYKAGKL